MSVKLLFDQNLSPHLVKRLADLYPNSNHSHLLGLDTADDMLIWEHVRQNDFVVVTKDADFADLSILRGFPPQVVWLRRGNCSTANIEKILRDHNDEIEELVRDATSSILTLF